MRYLSCGHKRSWSSECRERYFARAHIEQLLLGCIFRHGCKHQCNRDGDVILTLVSHHKNRPVEDHVSEIHPIIHSNSTEHGKAERHISAFKLIFWQDMRRTAGLGVQLETGDCQLSISSHQATFPSFLSLPVLRAQRASVAEPTAANRRTSISAVKPGHLTFYRIKHCRFFAVRTFHLRRFSKKKKKKNRAAFNCSKFAGKDAEISASSGVCIESKATVCQYPPWRNTQRRSGSPGRMLVSAELIAIGRAPPERLS